MEGYHNKPEATKEAITEDGWFRTGDIGRIDEDGFVFVEDRLKDMIISGGENIYSVEVERALTDHPAVLDAAVFGIPDEKWGESVKAVVELSAGESATPEELIALVPRAAGALQVPAAGGHLRRVAAQPHRQAAQARSAKAVLGEPRPRDLMLPALEDLLDRLHVVALPMRVRFRGITLREVALIDGPAGWG